MRLGQNQRGPALVHLRQLFQRGERPEGIIPADCQPACAG